MNERINQKKFGDVLARKYQPDSFIKVRCSKPKNESLKIHLVRKKAEYEYTEVIFAHELVKYGYDWTQI